MVVTVLVPLLFSACSLELPPQSARLDDPRVAVLPPDASVVFRLAPGRLAADLAEGGPVAGVDLSDASALGACGASGCLALVEGAPTRLDPASSAAAIVPARFDTHAPDGTPVVWRVLGRGKGVFGDAGAVEAAWQAVQAGAPGFDAQPFLDDVPAGETWLLVVNAEAFGSQVAGRLDRLATPSGHVVAESFERFDRFWPGLRARAVTFALALDEAEALVRVRVRCSTEADAIAVEGEARVRSAFAPVEVQSITREGLRVEITASVGELL